MLRRYTALRSASNSAQMDVESFILSQSCPPLLFHNAISDWPASSWTPEYLASQLPHQKMSCKMAPMSKEGDLWESDCEHENITLEDYVDWLKPEGDKGDNPLNKYDRHKYSCYIDYKYMKDVFIHHTDLLEGVKWENFGLGELDGWNSTIWIGSEGCYTNCHYDTYGFNLVAQIYGRKRWILFPPENINGMYPTRIPYEESSVYSDVNLKNPDYIHHPDFKTCRPYPVILEPGDVLYVPRHWWHYVECLEPAISINTWVDLDADRDARVHEAVTMAMIMSFNESLSSGNQTMVVNPGENLCSTETAVLLLRDALSHSSTSEKSSETENKLMKFAHHFQSVHPQDLPKDTRNLNASHKEVKYNSQLDVCLTCRSRIIPEFGEHRGQFSGLHDNQGKHEVSAPPDNRKGDYESCESKRKHSLDVDGSFIHKLRKMEDSSETGVDSSIKNVSRGCYDSEVTKKTSDKCSESQVCECKGKVTNSFEKIQSANTKTDVKEPEVFLLKCVSVDEMYGIKDHRERGISETVPAGCHRDTQGLDKTEFVDEALMTNTSKDSHHGNAECSSKANTVNKDDNALMTKTVVSDTSTSVSFIDDFVKCATHPDVISLIVDKLRSIKH